MKFGIWTISIAGAICIVSTVIANAQELTIASWGGAFQDAQRSAYFKPFSEASGVKILEDNYLGGWGPFKAMKDSGQYKWDIVEVQSSTMVRGCEEGIFRELDMSKIGDNDKFLPWAIVSDCGIGIASGSLVMSYNADTIGGNAPNTAADFFDLQAYPGKRALRSTPNLILEFALLADGVAPEDVYSTLEKAEGLNRAFAKLDTIKSEIQWWEGGAQAPEWLISGDVTMAITYNGRIANAQNQGHNLQMVWDRPVWYGDYLVVLAGRDNEQAAHDYLAFVSDPKRQADFINQLTYGPSVKGALDGIGRNITASLPAGANVENGLFASSEEGTLFWLDNLDEIGERFNEWRNSN